MNKTTSPQETLGVARTVAMHTDRSSFTTATGGDNADRWLTLLSFLRSGPWVNVETVLEAFEDELTRLSQNGNDEAARFRATCLAKLRLALIHAQAQSAPDTFERAEPDYIRLQFAQETARFFGTFGRRGRNADDLICLDHDELEEILTLVKERFALKTSPRNRLPMLAARMASRPRMVFRAPSKREFMSNLLTETEDPCSGGPMRADLMRSVFPFVQNLGEASA